MRFADSRIDAMCASQLIGKEVSIMNWDQVEGKWKQLKGSVKEKWGKLTDDDLDYIDGQRDQLVGKLQEQCGIAREDAQKRADEWLRTCQVEEPTGTGKAHAAKR